MVLLTRWNRAGNHIVLRTFQNWHPFRSSYRDTYQIIGIFLSLKIDYCNVLSRNSHHWINARFIFGFKKILWVLAQLLITHFVYFKELAFVLSHLILSTTQRQHCTMVFMSAEKLTHIDRSDWVSKTAEDWSSHSRNLSK